MDRLVLWLVFCCAVSLWFVRRNDLTLGAGLVILLVVPSWKGGVLTGVPYTSHGTGVPPIMPVTWYLLAAVAVRVLFRGREALFELRPQVGGLGALVVVALWSLDVTLAGIGTSGIAELMDSLVAPICVIAIASLPMTRRQALRLQWWTLGAGLAEAVWALAEELVRHSFVFTEPLKLSVQFAASQTSVYRSTATLDQPLTLGMFLIIAVGCSRIVDRLVLRTVIRILLIGAIAASGSRAALVGGLVVIVFGGGIPDMRGALVIGATAAAVAAIILVSPVGASLRARSVNDYGSAHARTASYETFAHLAGHYVLSGSGVGTSFAVAEASVGTGDSFENPIIMWAVDVGCWAALTLLLALIRLTIPRGAEPGLVLTGLVCIVYALTYSSFASRSAAGVVLAFAIALARTSRETQAGGAAHSRTGVQIHGVATEPRGGYPSNAPSV